MSDLSELIEITKNIEKQNTEIIRLLKKIAGEEEKSSKEIQYKSVIDYTPDFGDLFTSSKKSDEKTEEEPEKVENTLQIGTLLENSIDVGEVYFVDGQDIFKLSIENNETRIDNLTGDGEPDNFSLQEMVAKQSIENNIDLEDNSVILSTEQSQNLPETLRICVEQGACKIFMPLFASSQLLGAPQILMNILKFDFYKSEEQLIEKLFKV
ncbi:MAG: hypothetical protein E7Z77_00295 [Methanobrevibacter sp.]|uniref:hypothetical protein n=1 Tax=Methanobrevibacter sp. TaxID=66852 RepID=UPI0025F85611|nr:hypothetical protein [Methanobrevibacter sp.]MBE6507830.1 hypothetical protein [Methanobrevibacter sp.]